jgi:hypothetical protein
VSYGGFLGINRRLAIRQSISIDRKTYEAYIYPTLITADLLKLNSLHKAQT